MKTVNNTQTALTIMLSVITLVILTGCATNRNQSAGVASPASWEAEHLVAAARDAAIGAIKEKKESKSKELAEQGMELSERCLMSAPENPGCYYWRAVNTGLYYKIHIIGYQRGIKKMIEDCVKVISLDVGYDHAGAYRMLGQIYTMLPQTGGNAGSITRDLALAEKYLRKAVKLSPDYPENHIALAETLLALDRASESSKSLESAVLLAPRWQRDASYNEWKKSIASLEKKLGNQLK